MGTPRIQRLPERLRVEKFPICFSKDCLTTGACWTSEGQPESLRRSPKPGEGCLLIRPGASAKLFRSSGFVEAAKREPEKHADLVVRVAGDSAYCVKLTMLIWDEVLSRTELVGL